MRDNRSPDAGWIRPLQRGDLRRSKIGIDRLLHRLGPSNRRRSMTRFASIFGLASTTLPMEPQPMPGKQRPWFEGWFFRFVDHESRASAAVIFGSLRRRRGLKEHLPSCPFDEHLIVLAYRDRMGEDVMRSVILEGEAVKLTGGLKASQGEPLISWWSDTHGGMQVDREHSMVDVSFPYGVRLVANVSAPRIPWSTSKPNTAGPEGWLSQTGLLPCHYFVHSFGSPSTYTIWNRGERARGIGGTALTHMERNYGDAFPTGWVWAQASAESGSAFLVLTGGSFVIGPLTTHSYVIGLRMPLQRLAWDFRTTDLDHVVDKRSACDGTLFVNATSRNKRRRLEVLLVADPKTFGDPIMVPTDHAGFSDQPGCRESYAAFVHVSGWTQVKGHRAKSRNSNHMLPLQYRRQLSVQIPLGVLEFGGNFQCV